MSNNQNSSVLSLKSQAKALRIYLAEEGMEISHSKALEAISRAHGYRDWNTASAILSQKQDDEYTASVVKQFLRRSNRGGTVWRVHVMVEHVKTGSKAADFFDGFFTDAQIETKASKMAQEIQRDLAQVYRLPYPGSMRVSTAVAPEDEGIKPIIINGKAHDYEGSRMSYEDLITLAYGGLPPDGVVYSVTYSAQGGVDGMLTPGDSVRVQSGMVFSAYYTGNA